MTPFGRSLTLLPAYSVLVTIACAPATPTLTPEAMDALDCAAEAAGESGYSIEQRKTGEFTAIATRSRLSDMQETDYVRVLLRAGAGLAVTAMSVTHPSPGTSGGRNASQPGAGTPSAKAQRLASRIENECAHKAK